MTETAELAAKRQEPGSDVAGILRSGIELNSRTPRYEQLIQRLETAIQEGLLAPGDALPPEPELAAQLGLSRRTIREAWNDLARRGLLVRRRGIGTFVAHPAIEQPLGKLSSFVHTLSMAGEPPHVTLLGVRMTIDRDASPRLCGTPNGLVFEISRLFTTKHDPVVLERVYLSVDVGQRLPGDQLAEAVIDDLLRTEAGIDVDRGDEVLRLTHLGRSDAALLQAGHGDAAFLVLRTAYSGQEIVEVRRSIIRGDRAQFRIALHEQTGASFARPEPIDATATEPADAP